MKTADGFDFRNESLRKWVVNDYM
eukprot:SAG11_NODE_21173_length_430_cov_1.238671_2_plen_23_part_01